jgi:hypothetical protein
MANLIPPKLYKYQSIASGSYALDNLRNGQIWFSKPYLLNDPFDFAIPFTINGTDGEYQEFYDEMVNRLKIQGRLDEIEKNESLYVIDGKLISKFRKQIEETLLEENQKIINDKFSQMGVTCFSKRFDNVLMWSHYADRHKGLCLEFDTNYSPFNIQEYLHSVIYSELYPSLSPVDIFRSTHLAIDPLITKSKDWETEEEWRLIIADGNKLLEYDTKALTAIYFGYSMPDNQKKLISLMPSSSTARLYNMTRSNTNLKLEPVPYSG